MNIITVPFAKFLMFLTDSFNSYGLGIIVFGLVVKVILLPFQMKSKKSMMRTTMLQPQMKELERRYANNKEKYQEEVAKLYKEAKANPMSGCLWSFIPLFILIPLYQVVRQPLSKMLSLAAEEVTTLTNAIAEMGLYTIPERMDAYAEMKLANIMTQNFDAVLANPAVSSFADKLSPINFEFLGLNLANQPRLFFWNYIDEMGLYAAVMLFLLPIISAALSWLQGKLTQAMQSNDNPQAAQTAQTMNLMMPLMSVYICFIMPAAMGFYWIEQSLLGIIQEAILNRYYRRKLNAEMAEFNELQRKKNEELDRKRAETERLKAEGKTQVNTNTSKKRLAAKERNDAEQRAAAQRAAERAAKGLEKEIPASQVGTRRYARGRAYVADRYETAVTEEAVEAPVDAVKTEE